MIRKHTNPDGEIGEGALIGEGARIGAWARIGDGAAIGVRAEIGEGAVIGERAVIGTGAAIGAWAVIGTGAVIGAWAVIGTGAAIGAGAVIEENHRRHAVRSDGYVFTVGMLNGVPTVFAGCRVFSEPAARNHWGSDHPRHRETTRILDFLFNSEMPK